MSCVVGGSSAAGSFFTVVPVLAVPGAGLSSDAGVAQLGRSANSLISASFVLSNSYVILIFARSLLDGICDAGKLDIAIFSCQTTVASSWCDAARHRLASIWPELSQTKEKNHELCLASTHLRGSSYVHGMSLRALLSQVDPTIPQNFLSYDRQDGSSIIICVALSSCFQFLGSFLS